MQAQTAGAAQIAESLVTLSDSSRSATETLTEFRQASAHMVQAIDGLTDTVSRFRVAEE
jgi:methyl-accepting chemotaxis protein